MPNRPPAIAAVAVCFAVLAPSGAGLAQQGTGASIAGDETGRFVDAQVEGQLRAVEILGTTAADTRGEAIGKVEDLVLDERGRLVAVVMGVGGLLGIGEKRVAVPWRDLRVDRGGADGPDTGAALVLDRSREEFEAAPAFRTLDDVLARREAELGRQRLLDKQDRVPMTPVQQALQAVGQAQQALDQQDTPAAREALALARTALEQAVQAATPAGGGRQPAGR